VEELERKWESKEEKQIACEMEVRIGHDHRSGTANEQVTAIYGLKIKKWGT